MANEIIYKNLEAELIRATINKADLAANCGIALVTLRNKLSGKSEFTLAEICAIQSELQRLTDKTFTIDYLFVEDYLAKAGEDY